MDDELRKAAQDFADSVDGYENDLPLSAIRAKGALRAALAKNANVAPDAWTSVKAAMPQSGVTVLAYYKNRNGFERRIRAKWTAAKTVEANAEYGWGEYDEAADAYWTPEGWYECIDNWDEYSSVMVSEGEVTHWMPLPPAPQDPRQAALEQVSRDCQWQASLDDKRDAERYRWMRDNGEPEYFARVPYDLWGETIDAAMKEKNHG